MSPPEQTSSLRQRVAGAILDAAATVLAARGEQASMSDVAGAAGVARATVYRYFPNRETLLEALARAAIDDAGERLEAARLGEVAFEEAVTRAIRALVATGDGFVVTARQRGQAGSEDFEQRVAGPIEALLERGRSAGAIRDDMPASWQLEAFLAVAVSVLQAVPASGLEDRVAAISSLFLDGVRTRDPGKSLLT